MLNINSFIVDVNVATPDKKSVMMYVMCYFQVLPHSDIMMEDVPTLAAASDKSSNNITGATKPSVPSQVNIEHFNYQKKSKLCNFCQIFDLFDYQSVEPLGSTDSEGSEEVMNYQEALESVLAWLLEAEDNLHKQAQISEDVQHVKQQFHTHEVKIFSSDWAVILINDLAVTSWR